MSDGGGRKAKRSKITDKSAASFVHNEAEQHQDATEEESSSSEDEEAEDEPANVTQNSFLAADDATVPGNSASSHSAVDRALEQQQGSPSYPQVIRGVGSLSRAGEGTDERPGLSTRETTDPSPRGEQSAAVVVPVHRQGEVQPYFPASLARSQDQPTHFNFELFLLDTLTLPRGLFSDDRTVEVRFQNADECRTYCERYIRDCEPTVREDDASNELRAELSKENMFQNSGTPTRNLATGNPVYDADLEKIRIDVFGNVMILNAPAWSDISPQFTHGFPRRLIKESHRGLLEGNLTVSARISNQAIRSMSVGDVAGFASRKTVQGLGLTSSELVLARTSALKYAGKNQKPSRLIDMMLRFGVDFLTMKALSTQQVKDFRGTSTLHWERILDGHHSDSEEGGSDTSTDVEVPTSWNITEEWSVSTAAPDSDSVRVHICRLLTSFLSATTEARVEPPPPSSGDERSHSSGQRKKKKRKRPPAPGPVSPSSEPPAEVEGEQPPGPPEARAALEALQGVIQARIPKDISLLRLAEFLRNNQPLAPEEVAVVPGQDPAVVVTDQVRLQRFQTSYELDRARQVKQAVQSLWDASKRDCVCLGRPCTSSASQESDPSVNCPYCTEDEADIETVTRKCTNPECRVCVLMDHCEVVSMVAIGMNKNARLTGLLQFSKHIAHILNSGDIPEGRMTAISDALCSLLACGSTKLRCMANAGFLALLCPRLECLQLKQGWGDLWSNLSKIGSAVGHHRNRRSQLAALIFVRKRCIRQAESHWHYYLQSGNPEEEAEIAQNVFGDD